MALKRRRLGVQRACIYGLAQFQSSIVLPKVNVGNTARM